MVWFDSIYQLQYYTNPAGNPCYGENIVYANDMMLQGLLFNGQNPYTVAIYVYSVDGLVQYENATSYFDIYTAQSVDLQDYFNARLATFSPQMCSQKCFILRATVTSNGQKIFDKYTERYIVNAECCDVPRGIIVSQNGISSALVFTAPVPQSTSQPLSDCGDPLIRIISRFDCIDNFTGNFFGDPNIVYSGTADWNYTVVTSCKGRIVRRPRDITRQISYNCRLQRSESAPTYWLEAYEFFPAWKMVEIEGQLHSNHIWIDDYFTYKEYQYNGGTPFKKIDGASDCSEVFKFETIINECVQRQIFGCVNNCTAKNNGYLVISNAYESGAWYDENGLLIANTFDGIATSPYNAGLLQWLRGLNGITEVEEINISGFDCAAYTFAIVKIVSNGGYIPTSLYFNAVSNNNRIYTIISNDESVLCSYIGDNPCAKPISGTVIIEEMVCETPVEGDVLVEEITAESLTVSDYGDWVAEAAPDTEASVYEGQVTLSIETVNSSIIATMGDEYILSNETIATISGAGRPVSVQTVVSGTSIIAIYPNGAIQVSGTFTIAVTNELTLDFDGLLYNIT